MAVMALNLGLEGIGFADHCNVTDPGLSSHPAYSLHETYPERRTEIATLQNELDITLYDAVELDYDPDDESTIRSFLDEADFDYALGSVHTVEGVNVIKGDAVKDYSTSEKRQFVDEYFDTVVSLIKSEIFDIVSHIDVIERHPELRGLADTRHYRQVSTALTSSRTRPEINLGSIETLDALHPAREAIEILEQADSSFVFGSDAHSPTQLETRTNFLQTHQPELPETTTLPIENP